MNWTPSRLDQLDYLQRLIRECQAIDSANLIIDRLEKIIWLADAVGKADFAIAEESFIRWIKKDAEEFVRQKKGKQDER